MPSSLVEHITGDGHVNKVRVDDIFLLYQNSLAHCALDLSRTWYAVILVFRLFCFSLVLVSYLKNKVAFRLLTRTTLWRKGRSISG